jgi:hypothetical protein
MDRRASISIPGVKTSGPISQSASSTDCFSDHCLTSDPKTSDMDSFSAPGSL